MAELTTGSGGTTAEDERFGQGDLLSGKFFRGPIRSEETVRITGGIAAPGSIEDFPTEAVETGAVAAGPKPILERETVRITGGIAAPGSIEDFPTEAVERGIATDPDTSTRKNLRNTVDRTVPKGPIRPMGPLFPNVDLEAPDVNLPGLPNLGLAAAVLGAFVLVAVAINAFARGAGRGATS